MILARALGFVILISMVACQRKETAGGRSPSPSADTDLGHGYVRRDGAIHFIGGGTTGTGANATRIDTPSPYVLKGFKNAKIGPFKTAEGLDVGSFEALSEEYTRDKERVYFKFISPGVFLVIQLPEADPASFDVLTSALARDKKHVWYGNEIQSGADPATIELVNAGWSVFKVSSRLATEGFQESAPRPADDRGGQTDQVTSRAGTLPEFQFDQ